MSSTIRQVLDTPHRFSKNDVMLTLAQYMQSNIVLSPEEVEWAALHDQLEEEGDE
jgi:hypothetical protein